MTESEAREPATLQAGGYRPSPSWTALGGVLLASVGYLTPWFKLQPGYSWWFSGWEFASLSDGGGWTVLTFVGLAVALVASLWVRRSTAAAAVCAVAALATGGFAGVVVASCFTMVRTPSALNPVAELPFGIGIPLMAIGFATAVVGAIRWTARSGLPSDSPPA